MSKPLETRVKDILNRASHTRFHPKQKKKKKKRKEKKGRSVCDGVLTFPLVWSYVTIPQDMPAISICRTGVCGALALVFQFPS
ncbi:hypothetical protein LY76DRAFT_55899 [Colletotrichum caudatum]|nr:hypothetical protein LY76DRAFT_55899 [Colletotrichum caudatum]